MRTSIFTLVFFWAIIVTAQEQDNTYGAAFQANEPKTIWEVSNDIVMKGNVSSVCKAKGCWMKVTLEDGKSVFVKFKDYGFFVPTDFEGTEIFFKGKSFLEEVSVEEQRHYAADEGATEEQIAKINEPKPSYQFIATGVTVASEK